MNVMADKKTKTPERRRRPRDLPSAEFLAALGQRIRDLRARRGMSRRLLSEKSGVSQRYLAQLEGGEGNISIALLLRVAEALAVPVEWLIVADDPMASDASRLALLFRNASPERRQAALRLLEPSDLVDSRARRIAFIGLRGAGKSTLGALVAEHFGVDFVELNKMIHQDGGLRAEEIFALYGQEGYRLLEKRALEHLTEDKDELILAVGGGIVSEPPTFAFLLRNFHTIWLKAAPEEHMARVRQQGDSRPMSGLSNAMEELRSILTSREALYARAEATLDTSGRSVAQSTKEAIALIESRKFLSPQEGL